MCGIIGVFGADCQGLEIRERALEMASKIRHRGPDSSGIFSDKKLAIASERLCIMDVEGGSQPLFDASNANAVVANGEIYNHLELKRKLCKPHQWKTKSDCEILLYLFDEFGASFLDMLNGIFAFIIFDAKNNDYLIARDHLGICPLYLGWDKKGRLHAASEMKALTPFCKKIIEFPPGNYFLGSEKKFVSWYKPSWAKKIPESKCSLSELRERFEQAVKRQLMSDVPFGVLISGGLDSSLVAAIASKAALENKQVLHSFSIGLKDSSDLKFAKKVADFLGTTHHEVNFTVQEGIDALRDVIYHIESFDVTTVRASTPMYLLARKIRSCGLKMVLSGEGSDEIFGGYLYFHMAPNAKEFHEETVRKLFLLSKYDCLRANKSTAAWGIETRVPFLDKKFLDYAMEINPREKMCSGKKIEKEILRSAFDQFIPDEILWRQKEQFSDGVGYSWINSLKKHAEENISDEMMGAAKSEFPVGTPSTKEEYFYRKIFNRLFPSRAAAMTVPTGPTIACSTAAAVKWSKEFQNSRDPSGRSVKNIHISTIANEEIKSMS